VKAFYEQDNITIYHADCRDVLLLVPYGYVVTDPPYGQTSLTWDRWVDGWLSLVSASSMWCFGSLRMFMDRAADFKAAGWKLSQDVIWEKHNGSSFHRDRFKRVHEQPAHFYRGSWDRIFKMAVTTPDATARTVRRKTRPPHTGHINASAYVSHDGGPRLMRSVIRERSCHGFAKHETQKPVGIIAPLIDYAVPKDALVVDPFCGSGAVGKTCRFLGRRAVLIDIREQCCEMAANELRSTLSLEIA
jgi:site-specific DNA-methyltransferase (adenine-specific)